MLIILTVCPVAAPGKAVGHKELIAEVAGTKFMWKIAFPVGVGFRAGWRDPDAHAGGSVEAVCIAGIVGRGVVRISSAIACYVGRIICIFIDISYIGIKEGIDINSHTKGMAG